MFNLINNKMKCFCDEQEEIHYLKVEGDIGAEPI